MQFLRINSLKNHHQQKPMKKKILTNVQNIETSQTPHQHEYCMGERESYQYRHEKGLLFLLGQPEETAELLK